ncbi:hypothetical protein LEN26_015467 [Aphanomyces euteiches]|nr:hypothetical protein LEN26_015467 [Aphanomyces euteiches]KAH9114114.1 hypothetical protein AeMF1_011759 [Aphanomyces euteiches]KAH9195364.1 hypothetical protein AeNC1_002646 [Aphanomyces euteiches]
MDIGSVQVLVERHDAAWTPPARETIYRINSSDDADTMFWPGFPLDQPLWRNLLRMLDEVDVVLALEVQDMALEDSALILEAHLLYVGQQAKKTAWIRTFDYVLQHFEAALVPRRSVTTPAMLADARAAECHIIGCRLHSPSLQAAVSSHFNLPSLFKSLESPLEAIRMNVRPDASYVDRLTAGFTLVLTDMPMNTIWEVLKYLNARDIARMSSVCSLLQHVTYDTVPGLRLTLFPHQKKALKWMLYRESQSNAQLRQLEHPYIIGQWIDPVFGRVAMNCESQDTRGGFLCDEPGLGKTITMISLLLRTQGTLACPTNIMPTESWNNYGLRSSKQSGRTVSTDRLRASRASLIVVPDTLMAHWTNQFQLHTTGLNVLFDTSRTVPDADTLVLFDVVVTTLGRLAAHWIHRRPLSTLEARAPERLGRENQVTYADGVEYKALSPFLELHWVRIIVDEGHKLGGSLVTNAMQMLCGISAEKRWIMTGTPTPHVAQTDGLRHLHSLLRFLQEKPYGTDDDKPWLQAIARPFEAKCLKGYLRLERLLNRIMLRHVKADVTTIPKPTYLRTVVDPTPVEYRIYNGVVGVVRGNLVVTRWDPEFPGPLHKDSLLNPANRKDAMTAVANLRLAACGGGSMEVLLSTAHFVETVNYMNDFDMPWERRPIVQQYMRDAQENKCTACEVCRRELQFLMVTVCGHLICANCLEAYVEVHGFKVGMLVPCQVCGAMYDWEKFQELQPGFHYQWSDDERNSAQAAVAAAPHGILNPDEHVWSSSKGLYVLERIQTLLKTPAAELSRPIKCIIFSDFKEHIFRIRPDFTCAGVQHVSFVSGEVNMAKRIKHLAAFRANDNIHVLFMTEIGAIGLDLSFVTHIFLMDEIWDKSVEQQVIARAHRMGATDSVVVEQLEMRGSMEALVRELYSVPPDPTKKRTHDKARKKPAAKPKKNLFSVMNKESMSSMRIYHVLQNARMMDEPTHARQTSALDRDHDDQENAAKRTRRDG